MVSSYTFELNTRENCHFSCQNTNLQHMTIIINILIQFFWRRCVDFVATALKNFAHRFISSEEKTSGSLLLALFPKWFFFLRNSY